jgi:hypothetical protein
VEIANLTGIVNIFKLTNITQKFGPDHSCKIPGKIWPSQKKNIFPNPENFPKAAGGKMVAAATQFPC